MTASATRTLLVTAAALCAGTAAHAESFASSASSAGSASSGSVSTSFKGSSDSSTGRKTADGDYRVIEVAEAPDGARMARLTLQADDPAQRIVLDLPRSIVEAQRLVDGVTVHARQRDYGFEFSRADSREAFYLVLQDDWADGLAARRVRL